MTDGHVTHETHFISWTRVALLSNSHATPFPNTAALHSAQRCHENAKRWLANSFVYATKLHVQHAHTATLKLHNIVARQNCRCDIGLKAGIPTPVPLCKRVLRLTHGTGSVDDGGNGSQCHLVAVKTRVRAEIGRHRSRYETIRTVDQRSANSQQHWKHNFTTTTTSIERSFLQANLGQTVPLWFYSSESLWIGRMSAVT